MVNDPKSDKIVLTQLPRHQFKVGNVIATPDWNLTVVKVGRKSLKVSLTPTLRAQDIKKITEEIREAQGDAGTIIDPSKELKLCP